MGGVKRPSSPEVYEQDAGASAQVNIQLDGAPPAVFTLHAQLKPDWVRASAHERVKAGGWGGWGGCWGSSRWLSLGIPELPLSSLTFGSEF